MRDLKAEHPQGPGYFQFARNTVKAMARHFPAPAKCVDCVEAATTQRFDEGLAFEREQFLNLMLTPECAALRHAFFAERAAGKIPDVPEDTPTREIRKVAVIGAGTMGGGITMNFLNAGIPVVILEMKQEALDRGVGVMRQNYESQIKKGKLKQDKYEQRMALLSTTLSYDDIRDADLVIEAVFEDIGVKEQVFRKLDEVMKPGAILASRCGARQPARAGGLSRVGVGRAAGRRRHCRSLRPCCTSRTCMPFMARAMCFTECTWTSSPARS